MIFVIGSLDWIVVCGYVKSVGLSLRYLLKTKRPALLDDGLISEVAIAAGWEKLC